MPWTPESIDPLSADELSANALEETFCKLWAEFLGGWFSGSNHTIDGDAVAFPQATLVFQQTISPTSEDVIIHTVLSDPVQTVRKWSEDLSEGKRSLTRLKWSFFIRAKVKTAATGHNSRSLVRLGADRLYGLLVNRPLLIPLARKGIGRITPGISKLLMDSDYCTREIRCSGRLSFVTSAA